MRERGYYRCVESLYHVLKRLGKLPEQPKRNTYAFFKRQGFTMECVQTDNGFEFTNHFSNSKQELQTLFEKAIASLASGINSIACTHPDTPKHNGKAECSHREGQNRFYDTHRFYSLTYFVE